MEFKGWYAENGELVGQGDTIFIPTEDTTLYASWNNNTYIITLDNQEADIRLGTSVYYELYGVRLYKDATCLSLIRNIVVPEKNGCTFKGYFSEPNGGGEIYIDSLGTILTKTYDEFNTNTKLYAKWVPYTYTIQYNGNGGDGETVKSTHSYGVEKSLTQNNFKKEGYAFQGWALEPEGIAVFEDNEVVLNLSEKQDGVITLYAKWINDSYKVVYDGNGNTGGYTQQSMFKYNETTCLRINGFTKEGHAFWGWSTSANGDVVYKDEQEVLNIFSSATDGSMEEVPVVTLYAKWASLVGTWIATDANGRRNQRITDQDKYTEEIHFSGINLDVLRSLGYEKVTIKIEFDRKEINDGYQEFWCFTQDNNQFAYDKSEHDKGKKNTNWARYIAADIVTSIYNFKSSDGEFWMRWGAQGKYDDDWWLGFTKITMIVSK